MQVLHNLTKLIPNYDYAVATYKTYYFTRTLPVVWEQLQFSNAQCKCNSVLVTSTPDQSRFEVLLSWCKCIICWKPIRKHHEASVATRFETTWGRPRQHQWAKYVYNVSAIQELRIAFCTVSLNYCFLCAQKKKSFEEIDAIWQIIRSWYRYAMIPRPCRRMWSFRSWCHRSNRHHCTIPRIFSFPLTRHSPICHTEVSHFNPDASKSIPKLRIGSCSIFAPWQFSSVLRELSDFELRNRGLACAVSYLISLRLEEEYHILLREL